jgi:hypothetical protein
VARFGFERAAAEVLLRAVARESGIEERAIPSVPPLVQSSAQRKRVRAVVSRLPNGVGLVSGRINRFGSIFFFGALTA